MRSFRSVFRDSTLLAVEMRIGNVLGSFVLLALAFPAAALPVAVTNLVTDDQTVQPAQITDPDLVNPWGVSYLPVGPFWVADNETHKATVYSVVPCCHATSKLPLTVTIPGAGNVTGQASNTGSQFNGNLFLFVSEDGTISGWRQALGTTAETLQMPSSTNVYKGATLATIGANSYLYAANFSAGTIDVMKGSASAPDLTGNFGDPNLPAGYAPFNVQNLGDQLFVAYAIRDPATNEEVPGVGNGVVDQFDAQGNFVARIATGGDLNAPWGLAIAPSSFGALAGDLLVGNFGDGRINTFDLTSKTPSGSLTDLNGNPIAIDGLWALTPGNNGNAGSAQDIFFSAGPNEESHGVFGVLTAVPEPSTNALLGIGLAALLLVGGRRRRC